MRPQFEHVTIPDGCSIRVLNRRIPEIPFEWHHHPECELTLTLNSRGWRFIGDHVGLYDSHDLVLVPPQMPHTWASTRAIESSEPQVAIVVWFRESWASELAQTCPEYVALGRLLGRAASGLSFPASSGKMMEARLPDLLSNSARDRLRAALDILMSLSENEGLPLATTQKPPHATSDESAQLKRVLDLLHERLAEPLRMRDLCAAGNISERSLHRLFVRHLGANVTDYLGRLRIGRACMWLVETERSVSTISADAGFSNLSNFNRRFRSLRGMAPTEFRRYFELHGRMPGNADPGLMRRPVSLERSGREGGRGAN